MFNLIGRVGVREMMFFALSLVSFFLFNHELMAEEKPEIYLQLGHQSVINSVAMSPDKKFAITGSGDTTIKLWNVASGKEIRSFQGHSKDVNSVAFSPDGRFILSGSDDDTVRLWNADSGQEIRSYNGHSDDVNSVTFSPDGKFVLSGSDDGTIIFWDMISGDKIHTFQSPSGTYAVSFSPDGKTFLSAHSDSILRYWDISTGEILRVMEGHSSPALAVSFSPNGRFALSGSSDGTTRLWKIATGKEIASFGQKNEGQVDTASFDSKGKTILTSGSAGVRLWNVADGKLIFHYDTSILLVGIKTALLSNGAVFGPDEKSILLGQASSAKLLDIVSGKVIKEFKGLSKKVLSVAFHPNQKNVVVGGNDSAIRMWDISLGKMVRSFEGHSGNVYSVALSPDGNKVISSASDQTFKLWKTSTGEVIQTYKADSAVTSVDFSPDGSLAVLGLISGYDKNNGENIVLWDIAKERVKQKFKGQLFAVGDVAFADNRYFLSAGREGQLTRVGSIYNPAIDDSKKKLLTLWDAEKGKEVRTFAHEKPDGIISVASRVGGKYVATSSVFGLVQVWEVGTGDLVRQIELSGAATSAIFSPVGNLLLTSSEAGELFLFDIPSGKLIRTFKGHDGWVGGLCFSRDGKRAVSVGSDSTVRVWDVLTGKELVKMVSFSDGEWIVITPEGYYNSSLNGHKYLNVRMGNKVYGIDQFYDVFYRPDIVSAKLAGEDISEMITLTLDEAIRNPPPDVSVLTTLKKSSRELEKVSYKVDATGGGIGEVRVFHNGKLVKSDGFIRKPLESIMGATAVAMNSSAIKRSLRGLTQAVVEHKLSKSPIITEPKDDPFASSIEIEPIAGENEVSIVAFNAQNSVQSLMRTVHFTSTRKPVPPRLHILAIGIDKYLDKGSTLKFAAKDARDMAAKFKEKAEGTYGKNNVFMETLFDEQATRAGILARLDEISAKVKPTDHFVLFVASHGVLLGDQYYMVTHDYDGSLKSDRLISSNEIVDLSKRIKALSQLYILDTCHAGGMDGVISGLYDARMSVLAKKMGLHIFASSNSFEEALDGYKGNGLFTHNLLDGLNNNAGADANKDKEISLVELGRFSQQQTKAIAKGLGHQQEPMIINFGQDRTLYQLQ